ncbi:hypothetical protein ABEB36_004134 [Hypothenemus hampei]|uniref:Protoporphyrinogen oxidase n=1 Tax=Hypothenemus hampei TaxID=57062 RepID=A0ABD1F4Z0_HYPHA
MTRVVLGGGLSGLSTAYYLAKASVKEKVILLESSSRLGGWIKSDKVDQEVVFEQGPRTIRPVGAAGINTLNLLDELNLTKEVHAITRSHISARNRLIYCNGELHVLPNTLFRFITVQKPFSKSLFAHLLQDLAAKPEIKSDDSAYEFAKRRFGPEVADYLIDTMVCGICGGNSREVTVNLLMKNMFIYEQKYGSAIKGILNHLFDKQTDIPKKGLLAARAKIEKWSVYTFKEGLETLPLALEKSINNTVGIETKFNQNCKEIKFKKNGEVSIHLEGGEILNATHIFSAIPSKKLADLLRKQHPVLASKLASIGTITMGVVNFLYDGNLIKTPGFGLLVPPKENLPILGVIYDSCCRDYKDKTVLTVMMGGHWFRKYFGENPNELMLFNVAKDHLKLILNISEDPKLYKDIESYIEDKRLPISLCGSSYYGVGVNDVISSAKNAVYRLLSLN